MNERQKEIIIGGVHGLAENAQEDSHMHPEEYGVEHHEDFTWEMAVRHGADVLICAVDEDGVGGAEENGYFFDEDDDGNPTGLVDLPKEAVLAFLKGLKENPA